MWDGWSGGPEERNQGLVQRRWRRRYASDARRQSSTPAAGVAANPDLGARSISSRRSLLRRTLQIGGRKKYDEPNDRDREWGYHVRCEFNAYR